MNLSAYNTSRFEGTLQVQSQRTIFNSNYNSPVLKLHDRDINFTYQEFQPLFYVLVPISLISIISFMLFILYINADTFSLKGGDLYFDHTAYCEFSQQGGALVEAK